MQRIVMARRVISTLKIIAKPLPSAGLPTIGEVLSAIIHNSNPSLKAINAVTIDLLRIWSKHLIPVVTKARIRQMLQKEFHEYKQLVKVPTEQRSRTGYTEKVSNFQVNSIYLYICCKSM